jgi:hypothetical protein
VSIYGPVGQRFSVGDEFLPQRMNADGGSTDQENDAGRGRRARHVVKKQIHAMFDMSVNEV